MWVQSLGDKVFFPFSETGNPESYRFDTGDPNNISRLSKSVRLTILFAVGWFWTNVGNLTVWLPGNPAAFLSVWDKFMRFTLIDNISNISATRRLRNANQEQWFQAGVPWRSVRDDVKYRINCHILLFYYKGCHRLSFLF